MEICYNNSQWDPIRVCARKIKCSWMHLLKMLLRCINSVGCIKKRHAPRCIHKMQAILSVYPNNHAQIIQDVSANTNNFCNNLFDIYSQCCPIKENEISFRRLRKPWISDAIMVSLNSKHELFRQYKNGIVSFDHYNSFKNNFTTTLRHTRNNYFQRKFTECSNNSRDTWKTLNSLIRYKNTSKDVILHHDGSLVSDPSAIAEVFYNYFSNVASNLDRNIPHSNISPLNFLEYLWKIHFSALPLIGKKLLI